MGDCIAIIPARGGSKRIPKKNIKKFLGKEIISYPIDTALETNIFKEVIVSTDDPKIAEIAKKRGALVPFKRSKKNSDDWASTFDVIEEVLNKIEDSYRFICCLYPTSVFVKSDHLLTALNMLKTDKNLSTVSSVVKYSHPVERKLKIENEILSIVNKEKFDYRSQDLENYYHDAGQFYFSRTSHIMKERGIILEKTKPIILGNHESQDIDNEEDWLIAELKYSNLVGG